MGFFYTSLALVLLQFRMRFIFFFFLLTSFSYAYERKDIHLSEYEYTRYIQPQLISISQDYKNLFLALNPELKVFKSFYDNLGKVQKLIQELEYKNKKTLYSQLPELREELYSLLKELDHSHFDPKKQNFSTVAQFKSYKYFSELRQYLFKYISDVQDVYILYKLDATYKSPIVLIDHFYELENRFHHFLIYSSDIRFQTDFFNFWNSFLKPIQQRVIPLKDQDLFLRHLNDYNLTLNFLNVDLTKRNKEINKSAATILSTLHRRWVNILKVTLR